MYLPWEYNLTHQIRPRNFNDATAASLFSGLWKGSFPARAWVPERPKKCDSDRFQGQSQGQSVPETKRG
jgi:hypothetical protein